MKVKRSDEVAFWIELIAGALAMPAGPVVLCILRDGLAGIATAGKEAAAMVHAYRCIMLAVFPALGAIIVSLGFVGIRLVRQIKAAAE